MVSRTSGSNICLSSSAWPCKGSRMRGLDLFMTARESPTTKSVPILRPSRPSRAISTASETVCLSTSAFTWRFSEQISSNTCVFPMGSTSIPTVTCGQLDRKPRLAHLRPDEDLAPVRADDAPRHVEAEPDPGSDFFRREERLEYSGLVLARYPWPVVYDLDDEAPRLRVRPHGYLTATVHGVCGVVHQVGPDLVELSAVSRHLGKVFLVLPLHRYAFELVPEDGQGVLEAGDNIDLSGRGPVHERVLLHGPDEVGDAAGAGRDLVRQADELDRSSQPPQARRERPAA